LLLKAYLCSTDNYREILIAKITFFYFSFIFYASETIFRK